jgi:hypothetical protein
MCIECQLWRAVAGSDDCKEAAADAIVLPTPGGRSAAHMRALTTQQLVLPRGSRLRHRTLLDVAMQVGNVQAPVCPAYLSGPPRCSLRPLIRKRASSCPVSHGVAAQPSNSCYLQRGGLLSQVASRAARATHQPHPHIAMHTCASSGVIADTVTRFWAHGTTILGEAQLSCVEI